jgi:hypothetical protein
MSCRQCGFERYYFLADFTPSLPRGVPNLCPNCGKEWQRQICHYRKLVWMLCLGCGHQQYYIRHGRGRVEPVQCLQYALRGEHSWKRFRSAEGGYEQRCQFCHTPKFDKTKHRYLTNLGIIEEWLMLHQIPRVEDEYDESDEIELAISESVHWTTGPVSDMAYVYDVASDEAAEGADAYREAQESAPTAPLAPQGDARLGIIDRPDAAKREMRKRYRRILQRQESSRIRELRKRERIEPLIAKIRARCERNRIQEEELDELLQNVKRCLETFDGVIMKARTNERGRIPFDRLLSDEELDRLAAAATWFYVPGFTREQVAGTSDSIFPNVPVPTMKNWLEYVKLYESLE